MASYCVLAGVRLLVAPRADAVVFLTNPPLFACLGLLLKRLRGERFVYVVMDVYPDVAVRAGVLRVGSVATRLLRRVARAAMAGADSVVVLGDDMREAAVRGGADPGKVSVIRNWADPAAIVPVAHEGNRLRKAWGLDGKFVVAYSGNFGVSHSFEELLAAAEALAEDDGIRFLLIGGGVRFRDVERAVAARNLGNVVMMPYRDESELSGSLSAGDVHYISLRPGFEGLVVPSKAYGAMAAGRPIIYQGNAAGEIAAMVAREGIGVVVPPGDGNALRAAILAMRRDAATRERMGAAARKALEEKYSADAGFALYRRVLGAGSEDVPERRT
jgi:glycosyltransferase involved in cell wall biosynthesis